jgi:hypothetical protein
MGFRDYHPGLNRFLTRDTYNGALADLNLSLNPWTGNRYAFAGGNPITGIEHDGHCPIDACGAGTPIGGGRIAQTGPIDPGNPAAGYLRDGVWAPPAAPTSAQVNFFHTKVTAPDWATYTNAYLATMQQWTADGYRPPQPECMSPDTQCLGADNLDVTFFAEKLRQQPGITCPAHPSPGEQAMGAGGAAGMLSGNGLGGRGSGPAGAARMCSFDGDTLVVMADGSTKPISQIEVGDEVLATDPETGEQAAKEVTGVWVHDDTVMDLELDGEAVTTTEDHPFWNHTDQQWQLAEDLDPGDLLLTPDGTTIAVDGLDRSTAHTDTAYNLTVTDIHTYYVLAGDTPVLVHNTGPCGTSVAGDLGGLPVGKQSYVRTVGSESELRVLYNKWSQGGTDITPNGYNGSMVRLPDGTIVGWRNASKSGGATIDIQLPGGSVQKVHIDGP